MSRPRSAPGSTSGLRRLRPGLVALLVATLLPALGPAPASAADDPLAPLTISLTRLVPAAIPEQGDLTLAGTVTNDSDETWIAVNVHPFISRSPITTREELAAAAETPLTTEVGTRLVEPGQFEAIGDLEPGTSRPFRISIPAEDLASEISGAEGVYWIGLHALGQNFAGRDDLADGRARTFIPLVRQPKTTSVAVVVPVRERVRRDPSGRVLGTTAWSDSLTPSGRLGRLAGFLGTAGGRPMTLLVDPAVIEAIADLRDNNPPLSLGDGEAAGPDATPSPTPVSRAANRLDPTDRANAESWLQQVLATADEQTVLRLPYADPDVNALARRAPSMLELAGALASETFEGLEIDSTPAVAPPAGWLDESLLPQIGDEPIILVSDHGTPRARTTGRSTQGQDLVLTDRRTATGGPGPGAPLDALALRQRIAADAALRVGRVTSPMVVVLPDDWDPGPGWQLADFFSGLDQNWLDLVPVRRADSAAPVLEIPLGYPEPRRVQELTQVNVDATRALVRTTNTLDDLLRSENDVAHDLGGIAFNAVSVHANGDRARARGQVSSTDARMLSRIGAIEVVGTDFVTLSGGSGTLAVTVVNGLDQPVNVGVEATTAAPGVEIETTAPFTMAAGQRAVLRLKAEASGIGVNQVVLSAVTQDGTAVGTPLVFSLRTSQVGNLIWAILGAGALLLVVMITVRIRRGLREHSWRRT